MVASTRWGRIARAGAAITMTLLLTMVPQAQAQHGDIHATCNGGTPVVTQRPPGTEHVQVVCRNGLPEFLIDSGPVPTYDPVKQGNPMILPPDFGGWVTVWLNGRPLLAPYDPIRNIQEPSAFVASQGGRVMIPVRFFAEAFGGKVEWVEGERQVTLSMPDQGAAVRLWVGKTETLIGNRKVTMDQAPIIYQDRVFVPVRFLAESFGAVLTWDHDNRSVRVQWAGKECVNKTYCGEGR